MLVQTNSGPVLGFQDTYPISDRSTARLVASGQFGDQSPINKWLGIPYAQAARWKRPIPPTPWQEPLLCHEFGPYFPQGPDPVDMLYRGKTGLPPRAWREQSEKNGFNLNVFLPDGVKPGDNVPVLVWLYGGGLMFGAACLALYDPTEWLRREADEGRKFIVVTGNHRVGIFGFMACSDLAAEDDDGLAGNYGAYDCISYLQWVQDNISNFGGDPDRVTAVGESAGAIIIGNLLLYEKKLFRNAILQSGFPGTLGYLHLEDANAAYEIVCRNVLKDIPGGKRISALRELPAAQLIQSIPQAYGVFGLVVEKSSKAIWSSASPYKTLKEGKWNKYVKSVMLGLNKDEGSVFAFQLQTYTPEGYDNMCKTLFARMPRGEIDRLYPTTFVTSDSAGLPDLTSCPGFQILSDIFHIPVELFANTLTSTSHAETKERLELYMYKLCAKLPKIDEGRLGAFHSLDIPLLFNVKSAWAEDSPSVNISSLLGRTWFRFAECGSPDETWPPYEPGAPCRKTIHEDGRSTIEALETKSELEEARHKFYSQFC